MADDVKSQREDKRKIFRSHAKMLIQNQVLEIHTLDICSAGMAITCPHNLAAGIKCILHFSIIPNKALDVEAKVIYSIYSSKDGDFRVGLAFTKITPNQSAVIKKFVDT